MSRRLGVTTVATLILFAACSGLHAQQSRSAATPPSSSALQSAAPPEAYHHPPPHDRGGKVYVLGAACARKTDSHRGLVKRDACDRWYCGRADQKDVIEALPNFARDFNCTWRLEGDNCKCRRADYRPPQSQSVP